MATYPKPEPFTPSAVRGTVCYRDLCTIRRDNSQGGSGQPDYAEIVAENLLCEILQVSGGEVVRGRQVEAKTAFVICCPYIPNLAAINPKCEVELLSGPYAGQKVYVGRVYYENARSRPVATQLHCAASEGPGNEW